MQAIKINENYLKPNSKQLNIIKRQLKHCWKPIENN